MTEHRIISEQKEEETDEWRELMRRVADDSTKDGMARHDL